MLSSKQFAKELMPTAKVLELHVVFWPCETDDAEAADPDDSLANMPE